MPRKMEFASEELEAIDWNNNNTVNQFQQQDGVITTTIKVDVNVSRPPTRQSPKLAEDIKDVALDPQKNLTVDDYLNNSSVSASS